MSKPIFAHDIGHILQKLYDSQVNFRIESVPAKGFKWSLLKNYTGISGKEEIKFPESSFTKNIEMQPVMGGAASMESGISQTFEEAAWELCKTVVNNFPDVPQIEWLKEFLAEKNADANQL